MIEYERGHVEVEYGSKEDQDKGLQPMHPAKKSSSTRTVAPEYDSDGAKESEVEAKSDPIPFQQYMANRAALYNAATHIRLTKALVSHLWINRRKLKKFKKDLILFN